MKKRTFVWPIMLALMVAVIVLAACAPAPAETAVPAEQPTQPPAAEPAQPTQPEAATEAPPAEEMGPKRGGTLTFAMKEDVTSMDPLKAIQYGDIRLNVLVAQQLVAPDRDGKFVGVLAESWTASEDGKEWIFNLRKGVKFHNGAEMKADDVKWVFDRIMAEDSGAAMRGTFTGIGLVVEVVDDYTVKMTIESGQGPFLSYLALLNRSAIVHKDTYAEDGTVPAIIGTGPFKMVESKPGELYRLAKFEDYWKEGEPYLDEVVLRVITDPSVRLNAMRTGEVDMAEELPIADVKALVDNPDPNFTVQVYYFNSGARFVLNHTRPPFNNLEARKAVQYAFDREAYNEAVYFGLGQVHNQPFVPNDGWYLDVPMVMPDLTKAQEAFAASGLPQGTEITMLLMANQKDAAEIIDAMLSQVGFKVKFEIVDSAAWTARGQKLDYDLLMGTMTGIFDPDRPYGYLQSTSGGNWLVGGYNNPDMDALVIAGRGESDIEKRKEIYRQVLTLNQEDVATMYVVGLPWVEAWQNYVKGYQPGTSPVLMMMDASDGLNTTWLDK
ncbi:hypothetical protein ADN00_16005 [Ornatilinea apprima]|uniref:Solute-binding protein family 5 domain-containing protein n=1 Tax=Ornatilinea apprima TaxID=1134406 RepID=A0A0N8GLB1_9CHLR|nr:ABC transporter substrate-binding protein [Ornatilinea apprima]KPL72002.1 hypothetical protein ADN00_16005 [Ornatilinea apprima]